MTDRDRLMQHDDGSVFITNSASTFFSPISIVHTPYQMSRSITHTYSALVGGADSPSLSAVKSIRAKKEPRLSFRRKKSIDLRTAKPPASPRLASPPSPAAEKCLDVKNMCLARTGTRQHGGSNKGI